MANDRAGLSQHSGRPCRQGATCYCAADSKNLLMLQGVRCQSLGAVACMRRTALVGSQMSGRRPLKIQDMCPGGLQELRGPLSRRYECRLTYVALGWVLLLGYNIGYPHLGTTIPANRYTLAPDSCMEGPDKQSDLSWGPGGD
ncbi:hypothetical protein NDU88_001632 [Pleurodeles waltl]|uniref:Uncharacterized protein n=1 Tax=Pleurodeles waltl TaxID=8319 RepID=A0AAV7KQS8_PLEWA|nr:hypothetical protein NDU88_001632 [Pleurodeles waltl]